MAIANNTGLGFKFITSTTWDRRETQALTQEELSSGDIIFIEKTSQIYAGGIYVGINPDQASNLSTLWTDVEGTGGLKTKVSNLEERVGTEAKLSQTLLAIANDLKSKLDGGSYTGEGDAGTTITVTKKVNGVDTPITNVVEAVNAIYSNINSMVAGFSSVNNKSGAVTLKGSDIEVSDSNSDKIDVALGKKVAISTDATVKTNTGKKASDYTDTKVIGDAIEAAHAAAASADSNADTRIAKSPDDTTAKNISGATGSTLTTAAAIATAIETACDRLIKDSTNQAQTNWAQGELKTLTTLRNLIKDVNGRIDTLTSGDLTTIQNAITAIKNELQGTEEDAGGIRQLTNSLLDAIATVLPTKANGTYTFTIGSGGTAVSKTTIQGVIDELVTRIGNAAGAGVTKITAGDGISVSGTGVGDVTVGATSAAKLTATLTTVANGATTAQGETIQTALNDINAKAAQGIGDAASAASAASAAQGSANAALNQLKWQVV